MTRELSASLEDYLEAIAELNAVEGHAHSKEIAAKLGVKMPSVTGALRQLVDMGYIIYEVHYPVQLTPSGKAVAENIIKRHRELKRFLSDVLDLSPAKAAETACQLEHAVDDDIITRLIIFSDALISRSDAGGLQTYLTEAIDHLAAEEDFCVLSFLAPEEKAAVHSFSRNLKDPDKYSAILKKTVHITGFSLDKSRLKLSDGKEQWEIPMTDAENIWVTKLPVRR